MVVKTLSDFQTQKNVIALAIAQKKLNGQYDANLHSLFEKPPLTIDDAITIIEAIEKKLRELETIFYTYFDSEFDSSIIVNRSLIKNKIIETEFDYSTKNIKNRIEISDAEMYKEIIDFKFQVFILTTASLHENLVRLIELFLKKIVVYGGRNPYISTPLQILISNWDNLIELNYRTSDVFYLWLNTYRPFFEKYLFQLNGMRNSFIHGYNVNLYVESTNFLYAIKRIDSKSNGFRKTNSGVLDPDLVVNKFTEDILTNTKSFTSTLLDLISVEATDPRNNIPM